MAKAAEPPSGTRDFLADDLRRRKAACDAVSAVFEHHGFDPLETPAFERLEVFTGKLGEEASALIFKILKRGVHEASGEADMALRYDHTVPLARVMGTYGGKLPSPFKRYAIGNVWRADRPAKGRFREFTQCDIDTVGSASPLADAEIVLAINAALEALGVTNFRFLVNSRQALYGLLDAYGIDSARGSEVLGVLDKLDKVGEESTVVDLVSRGLSPDTARTLVEDVTNPNTDRLRGRLDHTERGKNGVSEVDTLLSLTAGLPAGRVVYTPRMVRGLDYYTGPIWEVEAEGYPGSIASGGRYDGLVAQLGGPDQPACGGSIGIERILAAQATEEGDAGSAGLDVAVTVLSDEAATLALAQQFRAAGLRTGLYLGASSKLAKQLAWASDRGARFAVLYGQHEQAAGEVTLRNMASGEQQRVLVDQAASVLREQLG